MIGNGYSIVFPCVYCEQTILIDYESIGGMAVCSGCHRAQDVPPIPCRYREECDGYYQHCGGFLNPDGSERKSDEPGFVFCDDCDAVYPHNAAPEKCTRILCNKCRRPIL